jgi:hypothetical protein
MARKLDFDRHRHAGKPTLDARDGQPHHRNGGFLRLTDAQIEAGKTAAGGFTAKQLRAWA